MADTAVQVTISADNHRRLVRLLRTAYPHDNFPDGPYERTADAVVERARTSVYLSLGLAQGLESLGEDISYERLVRIEDAEFFRLIRSVAVVSLYNDPQVWEILGYEGESFSKGGYLHRGFDDLDWLPTPRVEEYDGPDELVEVAEADQPANEGGRK